MIFRVFMVQQLVCICKEYPHVGGAMPKYHQKVDEFKHNHFDNYIQDA